ncbi:chromate transporter [Sediminibacterium soli]|uniref:chromate transporter n=1 Tax=Sediminibacterium soli TaxID=2698829 RepID=UPI00137983A8|nr:chromate transporter [Sediminibacterium soli]NCI48234.1 chromate transporter [Sediminibacterium soli]
MGQQLYKERAYSLRNLIIYFLKLGTTGFGGPVALVGYMHRDLVEEKKWISEDEYREGLALSQLAPGPLAAQLAIYIGYIHYRIVGATLTGIAFVLPSFLIVMVLAVIYIQYGGLPGIQAVFFGIGAAVIGIIAIGGFRLSKKSLGKDRLLWFIFIVNAVATVWFEEEHIWLILSGGLIYWLYRSRSLVRLSAHMLYIPVLLQITTTTADATTLQRIAWFFLKAGTFVFGSGLAIVPFLYGGVVKEHAWLNDQQFLDAVAVAMITPGPVVITVGFIGFLIAGFPGACVAALATFIPCYLFTILPAPYFKKYGKNRMVKLWVDGITAAATGAIAGAVVILAKRQLTDVISMTVAFATILVLLRFKKIKEPWIILVAAILGILIKQLVY